MAGIFDSIFAVAPSAQETKAVGFSERLLAAFLGHNTVKSGVAVNYRTAVQVTTVLSCVRVIAEGMAQIPLKLMQEREDGGGEVASKHRLHNLLAYRPNDWMTSFEFRETLTMHAALAGTGYAYKVKNSRDEILELIPIAPENRCTRQDNGWDVVVDVGDENGLIGTYPASDFLRINGPSWNGYGGLDLTHEAREAIGLAIATEENHSRLFSNGARPGGILSVEGTLNDKSKDRLVEAWNKSRAKLDNAFKTAVLPANVKWQPMAMSGVDAQHIETRKFQIEEICRALKVFPQMVGYADKTATFASAEAFFLAHVIYTLMPWCRRWEDAIARDLIAKSDVGHYAKFVVQGLMRGDAKARSEYYSSGIQAGWLTRADARRLEDLNPISGLEEPLIPLNMGTLAERDALVKNIADAVKSSLIGSNGGPEQDDIAETIRKRAADILSAPAPRIQ
ncbi:phage portal protein [Oceanibaculum indicum]|uniref:HK97 family phage portal protein n=1 Tax=Oceanibaculum indicum TaxID=526216 RepID=A0A420WGL1_9PROT|nr:phage portal protein [Oceanibaculum indicum]RKQ70131.1 HK97 family phage portal protein [Oceanibaculum indicum]